LEKRIDWQTAVIGICTVVVTLLGTGTQISPIDAGQKDITGKLLELSEANRALNKLILESVSESHTLNVEMLKVVDERRELFKQITDKLSVIEAKLK